MNSKQIYVKRKVNLIFLEISSAVFVKRIKWKKFRLIYLHRIIINILNFDLKFTIGCDQFLQM